MSELLLAETQTLCVLNAGLGGGVLLGSTLYGGFIVIDARAGLVRVRVSVCLGGNLSKEQHDQPVVGVLDDEGG